MSLRSIRVLLLDGLQRVVDELAGGGDLVTVISVPGGSLAESCTVFHRASAGTQNTFFSR